MKRRGSGILLHMTSLPSRYGIGDLGPSAYSFADFLASSRQSYWQILPLNPTDPAFDNSPYHSISAFAFNPLLISPELLVKDGLLNRSDLEPIPRYPKGRIDYRMVISYKKRLFQKAYSAFKERGEDCEYELFCSKNSHWIDEYTLFVSLKEYFQKKDWGEWPVEIRDRQPKALKTLKNQLRDRIEMERFFQYILKHQWFLLKEYCNQKGIHLIGDIPIYVEYDSADVWTQPELFKLDNKKKPYAVAGVPPDYYCRTGQLWGNPVYRWDVMKQTGYAWWFRRIEHNLKLFDFVRIDHFRGFVAFWEVKATHKTAMKGEWIEAPAEDFFHQMVKKFPCLPIIAEDLGVITPDVREIMSRYEFLGTKVLLFAFEGDLSMNPYIPHNLVRECVLYTGTHDNNTSKGWFENEATQKEKERLFEYLGKRIPVSEIHWELIRLAMMSVANFVIFPMQDILGLGREARMNRPGTNRGNWCWQLLQEQLKPSLNKKLLRMTEIYGRA